MTWPRRSGRANEEGIVILDALISLILLSMTLTLFAMSLHFALRVAESGRVRDRVADFAVGTDALSAWLAAALPVKEAYPGGQSRVLFEGRSDYLSFVTLSNGDVQAGGMLQVTIALKEAGVVGFEALPLAVGTRSLTGGSSPRQVLFSNAASLAFRYYGVPVEGSPAKWLDEWRNAATLPRLVTLRTGVQLNRRTEVFELTFRVFSN